MFLTFVSLSPQAGGDLLRVDLPCDEDKHTTSGGELYKVFQKPTPFLLLILHHFYDLERGREGEGGGGGGGGGRRK